MFNDLSLVHQKTSEKTALPYLSEQLAQDSNWFYLPTCLRKIAVGPSAQLETEKLNNEDVEVFHGAQAYRFMLEVICGLKSPLVGETEIFGQFKSAAQDYEAVAHIGSAPLRKFLKALNEDAKRIRELHLKDLGSQSYGSLVRKELKKVREIHVIGAGQLTREILPWLGKDGAEVHVHVRDEKRARKALSAFQNIVVHQITDRKLQVNTTSSMIVAAPVEAKWLSEWAQGSNFEVVIDLRGDSHLDLPQLKTEKSVLLKQLFDRITENQNILHERKDRALKEINQAVSVREQHVEYRPFGWEDVCA